MSYCEYDLRFSFYPREVEETQIAKVEDLNINVLSKGYRIDVTVDGNLQGFEDFKIVLCSAGGDKPTLFRDGIAIHSEVNFREDSRGRYSLDMQNIIFGRDGPVRLNKDIVEIKVSFTKRY